MIIITLVIINWGLASFPGGIGMRIVQHCGVVNVMGAIKRGRRPSYLQFKAGGLTAGNIWFGLRFSICLCRWGVGRSPKVKISQRVTP